MQFQHLLDNPWEYRQQLQYFADAMSFAEEVPVRLLDKERLDKLPTIFADIAKDRLWGSIYRDTNGEGANLENEIDRFKQEINSDFERFFREHLQVFAEIWDGFRELRSIEKLDDNDKKHNNSSTSFDTNKETQVWDEILKKQEKISLSLCNRKYERHICLYTKYKKALHFTLQAAEHQIWLTSTSNDIPIHMMLRTDPSWRSLTLIWFYLNRHKLTQQAKADIGSRHDFLSMSADVWYMHVESINPNIYATFAPICYADETTRRRAFFLGNGLKLFYVFRCFHEIFEDHELNSVPSRESYTQAISKRALVLSTITAKRVSRVVRTLRMLQTFETKYDLEKFKKLDCIMLATAIRFVGHHNKEFCKKLNTVDNQNVLYYIKVNGCSALWLKILANSGHENFHSDTECTSEKNLSISICSIPEGVDSKYKWHLYIPSITRNEFPNDELFYLEEVYRDNQQRFNARIRNYNAFRLGILGSWMERHFGEITHENNNTRTRDRIELNQFICAAIADLLRANHAIIWICDFANGGRLSLAGDFSYDPDFMDPKARKGLLVKMEEQYKKFITGDEKLDSICYRVLRSNCWQIIEDVDSESGNVLHDDQLITKIRSALAVPIHFNGRLLGVIEATGCYAGQFLWSQLNTLADIANMISPHLYHLNFVSALRQVSAAVRNDIVNSRVTYYDSTLRFETSQLICRQLNKIFLCSHSSFWLRSNFNAHRFDLCALSLSREELLDSKGNNRMIGDFFNVTKAGDGELPLLWVKNPDLIGYEFRGDNEPYNYNAYNTYILLSGDNETSDPNDLAPLDSVQFPQRRWLYEDYQMRELFCFGVRANSSKNFISAYFGFYSHSDLGFSASWQSIINMVEQQLQVELAFLGAFENKGMQTNRLLLHEIRHAALGIVKQTRTLDSRESYFASTIDDLKNSIFQINVASSDSVETLVKESINLLRRFDASSHKIKKILAKNIRELLWHIDPVFSRARDLEVTLPDNRKARHFILDGGQELNTLIRWLALSNEIDISSILAHGIDTKDLKLGLLDVRSEVDSLKSIYNARENQGRILIFDFEGSWQINTIERPFQRVLHNLVDNAFKYSSPETAVQVVIHSPTLKASSQWRLTVSSISSNPPGADFRPFDLYWKSMLHREDGSAGEGIGLYIVQQLCIHLLLARASCDIKKLGKGKYQYSFKVSSNG